MTVYISHPSQAARYVDKRLETLESAFSSFDNDTEG